MRRFRLFIVGALVLGALVPAVALAASSPTVADRGGDERDHGLGGADRHGQSERGADRLLVQLRHQLGARHDHDGQARRAWHQGRRPSSSRSRGLIPGTTYYYQLGALSTKGGTAGQIRTFKTAGPPPPGAVTGAATAVGSTTATINGTIDTNGATTSWNVQYGTTTSLRGQHDPADGGQQRDPGAGLGAAQRSGTADAVPLPDRRVPQRRVDRRGRGRHVLHRADEAAGAEPADEDDAQAATRSRRTRSRRSGRCAGNAVVPPTLRCVGNATVNYYSGKTRTAHVLAPVQPNCTFAAHVSFRRSHGKGVGPDHGQDPLPRQRLSGRRQEGRPREGRAQVGRSRSCAARTAPRPSAPRRDAPD